jgi:hypothetical protein
MALFYVTAKKILTKGFIFTANNREEAERSVRDFLLVHDEDDLEWEDRVEYEVTSEIKKGDVEIPSD